MTQDWKKLRDDWMMYHAELYQPGSPINTMTIFDWWVAKLKEERNAVLSEVEREVEKFKRTDQGQYNLEHPENIRFNNSIGDISTIINNLRVKLD